MTGFFGRFSFPLLALVLASATRALSASDSEASGTFKGNDQPARISFVSAHKGTTLADKETTMLIFTEKDHSTEKRPGTKASSGDFGSALIVTVHADGKIVGCEVAHQAHINKPFNSIGPIRMSDFRIEGGQMRGRISTNGKAETFQQSWEVDLTFRIKVP